MIFHLLIEIVLEVKKAVPLAKRDAMDRDSFPFRIPGSNFLERFVLGRGLVADDRSLVPFVDGFAGEALRINLGSRSPVWKERVDDESDAQPFPLWCRTSVIAIRRGRKQTPVPPHFLPFDKTQSVAE